MNAAAQTSETESGYTYTRYGLPGRVIAFFRANPDEELGLEDIASKFDVVQASIHTLLSRATDAELLKRERDRDGDWVYMRGPALKDEPEQLRVVAANDGNLELDAIKIETGVPVDKPRTGRPRFEWPELWAKMKVGDSCVLPNYKRESLRVAIKRHEAAGLTERFAVRPLPDKKNFRMWRIE